VCDGQRSEVRDVLTRAKITGIELDRITEIDMLVGEWLAPATFRRL